MACHVLAAPPAKRTPDPLTVLLAHGLADVRGAQRVSIEYSIGQDLIGHAPDRNRVKVPGWLLREEPGGRLTLLVNEIRELHGQRATRAELDEWDEASRPLPPEPRVVITPLEVREEIKRLLQGRKAPARPQAESTVDDPNPPKEADGSPSETLLFLAHLQQRQQPEVKALLARVLPAGKLPALLTESLDAMANTQLENLYDRWIDTGDASAYATGLETLARQSWRGWAKRDGVRLLAGYARAAATHPPENETAAFLSGLRDANIPELPLETNWLLPKSRVQRLPAPDAYEFSSYSLGNRNIFLMPEKARAAAASPVAAFFHGRLVTAKLLLPLLESHRPSRLLRDPSSQTPGASASPQQIYTGLYRPYEVGEIAALVLKDIYPADFVFDESGAEFKRDITAWVQQLEGKSDEEMAWLYLEKCAQPEGRAFERALVMLVELRAPAAPARLKDLLRDPMIWSWPLIGQLAPLLPAYLDSLGPERAAFGADLLVALKTGIESRPQIGGMHTFNTDPPWGGDITWEREFGPRALKLVTLLVEGSTLPGLVNRYALLEGAEAAGVLDALRIGVVGHFDRELEAHIFRTAARFDDPTPKMLLLEIARHFADTIKLGPPMDPATRTAVETLLADDSQVSSLIARLGDTAEMAAYALLHSRLTAAEETSFETLEFESVKETWKKLAIAAALAGEALPPVPDGPDLTGDEIAALTAGWKDWNGLEILSATHALPLETQVRLMRGLGQQPQWAAPLVRAQLTIAEVAEDDQELQRWKGRTFDEKLRDELAAVVRERAAQGRHSEFGVDARHALSGLTLYVMEFKDRTALTSRERLAEYKLPGLAKLRPPDLVGEELLTFWRMRWNSSHEALALTPGWKDEALTASWLRDFGDRPAPRIGLYPSRVNDRPALKALLSRIENGESKLVRRFRFETSASPIVDNPKAGE